MLAFLLAKFNILRRNEAGVSLIETLIALALLGMISVPFLSGLAATSKASLIGDERTTAECLARSQMEYIKGQTYIDYSDPGHGEYVLVTPPVDYTVGVIAEPIDPYTGGSLPSGQDDGLQQITVTVIRDGESVIAIDSYKVYRGD